MTKADKVELELWRSGLLSSAARNQDIKLAARAISRAATTLDRINLEACNGVPKEWDSARREWCMGLDESDMEHHEHETKKARAAIMSAAREVMKRGLLFTWYTDPRGGSVVRIYNKANTKDMFV